MTSNSALVVVDMLHDFIDGSLACKNAEEAVREAVKFIDEKTGSESSGENEILDTFPILFVCDCHPEKHCSFKENGGTWPRHCVTGTHGGEIHEALQPYVVEELVFDKGCDPNVEQYSGFDGKNNAGQSLGEILGLLDTEEVYVCGIATEYCVRNTCEDLQKAGFKVSVVEKALACVTVQGHEEAIKAMKDEGIRII